MRREERNSYWILTLANVKPYIWEWKKLKLTSRLLGKELEYFDNEVDLGIWKVLS